MAFFQTTPGFDECPKCFGWQIRDLTPRDAKGWPIGPANIVDCDHCGGKGEVPGTAPVGGWGRGVPVQPGTNPEALIGQPMVVEVKRRRGRPPKVVSIAPAADATLTLCHCGSDMAAAYCPCQKQPEPQAKSWDEVFADKQKVESGWMNKPPEAPPAPLAEGWANFQTGEKAVDTPAEPATGWAVFQESGNEQC